MRPTPTKSWSQEFWEYEQENSVKKAQSEENLINKLATLIRIMDIPNATKQELTILADKAVQNGSIVLGARIKGALG